MQYLYIRSSYSEFVNFKLPKLYDKEKIGLKIYTSFYMVYEYYELMVFGELDALIC